MNFFLKGKHWHVFLALFGLPILGIIAFMLLMVLYAEGHVSLSAIAITITATISIALVLFVVWFYTLVEALHAKLPKGVKMNLLLFKVFLMAPVFFMLQFTVTIYKTLHAMSIADTPDPAAVAINDPLLIPLFLLAMFCMFYCLLFAAKTFKSVELQREVDLPDYIAELFQLWYFPLGVWLLQPRINRIFSKG